MKPNQINHDKATALVRSWQQCPFKFNDDIFGYHFWSRQRDILQLFKDGATRVSVKTVNEVGKSFLAAFVATWNLICFTPSFTFTTAPTYRQVNKIIWREIRKGFNVAKYPLALKPPLSGSPEWMIKPDKWAFGVSSDKPAAIQGLHETDNVMAILDEVCGIDEVMFPAVHALATAEGDRILYIGNPDSRNRDFMHTFKSSLWQNISIKAEDTPNFTGETVPDYLSRSLISRSYIDELVKRYGEGHPIVGTKRDAEFPKEGEDSLISLTLCERAQERSVKLQGRKTAGLDVARYGDDKTEIYTITGNKADLFYEGGKTSEPEVVGQGMRVINQGYKLAVDGGGLTGVVDWIRKQDRRCTEVNFGTSKCLLRPEEYLNVRAEMYDNLRIWIRDEGVLPNDPELIEELIAIKYKIRDDGRLQLPPKDEIKKALGRSPDKSDALALAVAGHGYNEKTESLSSRDEVFTGSSVLETF